MGINPQRENRLILTKIGKNMVITLHLRVSLVIYGVNGYRKIGKKNCIEDV